MYDDPFPRLHIPLVVITAAVSAPAYAVQYLNVEQAQRVLFPQADRFISRPVRLDDTQRAAVERYSRIRLRADEQPVWRVEKNHEHLGWFVLDEVYGKHEFITYAVALSEDGNVLGVEILDYRETHGGEVRNPAWRRQFAGKGYGDELRLGRTIENISGATLSCKHVTEGVRRILAIHEAALK